MKYKITATNHQLKTIGVDFDISGYECEMIKTYASGFKSVKVLYTDPTYPEKYQREKEYTFDIPQRWLEMIG